MTNLSNNATTEQPTAAVETVNDFFTCFDPEEARKLLHKMIRSAFSQKNLLDKRDILDFLHLKEKLAMLIKAAEILAKDGTNNKILEKFFKRMNAGEWIEWLDELFHAAVYDGFFVTPPSDEDVYHSCRMLFKMVKDCYVFIEWSSISSD